ncbi:hypothetical protein BKA93DRAFT_926182 [Sparassis latifolia]|uniref:RING-type domain-containing protein n=1 Tax=Sparassis crispa TaxID=139825 RepID=A0A401GGK1_9APHY|nr:hypothetical protein SCP_0310430 [Sparassis crispa]GBE81316.1 hypothetical protein SCP_0310430 [Sparassis crispa]
MPATRSSRRAQSREPLTSHPINAGASSPDIIILSSDDELAIPKQNRLTPKKSKQRVRSKPRISADVIVLSDDEGPEASTSTVPRGTTPSLRQQLKEAKEMIARLEAEARAWEQKDKASQGLLPALDEHVNCEVCTLKMWTPATLACGHTFCQSCLQDWFTTALTQHMAANPDYDAQPAIIQQYKAALQNPNTTSQARRQLANHINELLEHIPQPQYTCPSCRAPVKSKPIEVFRLKHITRTVAAATGETSPKKAAPARTTRGVANRRAAADGPWDGFFPWTP